MRVPVLVISAPREGVLQLNGQFAGEVGPDAPLTLPLSPGGRHSLAYQPYGRGEALAVRLCFEGDKLRGDPSLDCVHVTRRAGGAWEVAFAAASRAPTPRTLGRASVGGCTASLIEQGGVSVAVADASGQPFSCPAPEGMSDIALTARERPAPAFQLLGMCEGQKRLVLLSAATGTVLVDASGDELFAPEDEARIVARRAFADVARHAHETVWQAEEGVWTRSERVLPAGSALRMPETPEDTALALCQAVALGEGREAQGYLSSGLRREIEGGRLATYLGPFDGCIPCGVLADEALVEVLQPLSPSYTTSRLYAFRILHAPDPSGPYKVDDVRLVAE